MAEPTRGPVVQTDENEDIWQTAIRHANEAWTAESYNYDLARDDMRFYAGEQWLPDAVNERQAANRPVITINRLTGFVRQVTGDARKDTPAIKVAPSKDGASQEVAEIYNGLIRNIENESNAKAHYVRGLENACITGMGAFWVTTVYSADDAFEQDIRIFGDPDPFSTLFDPAAREPDKSDARYVLRFKDMPKEEFAKAYPDQPTSDFPSGPYSIQGLSWFTINTVRVAQYWYRKPVKKQLLLLGDGRVLDAEAALRESELGQPIDVVQKRTVDTFEVEMVVVNGVSTLSGPHKWAGKYIPACPVIGEELYVDGRIIRRGMIRDAKDPQRVYNYMRTAAVEGAANQPKAPYIATVDQMKGLEPFWNTAGSKNHPFLPYNPDPKAGGPPQRSPPPLAQNGLDSQAQISIDDLKGVTGIYDASLGAKSNETSGRAILARQKEGDTGTYYFMDNLATAIRYCGKILVDLIPKIYDTARVVRVLKEDGDHEMAEINKQTTEVDEVTGAFKLMNDLAAGEYDVTVITGPSFATRRQEAANGIIELVRSVPQIGQIAGDLLVKNLDIPGSEEIAARLRRTIPPNVLEDQDTPVPPPPQVVAELEKTAAEIDQIKADTEGKQIENIGGGLGLLQMLQSMHVTMQQVQAQLQAGIAPQPQGQPGAPPMPGPPPMPPGGEAGGEMELVPMPVGPAIDAEAATEMELVPMPGHDAMAPAE